MRHSFIFFFFFPQSPKNAIGALISLGWNLLIGGMVGYFALSLVEALAMQELRRQHEVELSQLSAETVEDSVRIAFYDSNFANFR
jgi:hypothetical protein